MDSLMKCFRKVFVIEVTGLQEVIQIPICQACIETDKLEFA
jgi:hypothetical protein